MITYDPGKQIAPDGEEIVTLTEESLYETFPTTSKAYRDLLELERAKKFRSTTVEKKSVRQNHIAKTSAFPNPTAKRVYHTTSVADHSLELSSERKGVPNIQSSEVYKGRYKRRCCSLIPAKSDSLPHAHAQTTKTYYKHQDSRIKKAQDLKTKTSTNFDIQDLPSRYQVYQGRLLASFQDDAKYEHVGKDTRSQGGKDDKDKQGKDLKILELKSKSKRKGSRSKITQHEGTSLQQR
ncbi:hypothetical protein Tco_1418784 [Tanacetum coccineum]